MGSQWINIIGLVLDMVGVFMLFKTGLPPDLNMLELYYDAPIKEEYKPVIKQRELRTNVAFGLVVMGFFLQIIAAFISVF